MKLFIHGLETMSLVKTGQIYGLMKASQYLEKEKFVKYYMEKNL